MTFKQPFTLRTACRAMPSAESDPARPTVAPGPNLSLRKLQIDSPLQSSGIAAKASKYAPPKDRNNKDV